MFFETPFVLFRLARGLHDEFKGISCMNIRRKLRCETLDDQRIVCSTVFIMFREFTIFSVKLSIYPYFVVVRKLCVTCLTVYLLWCRVPTLSINIYGGKC